MFGVPTGLARPAGTVLPVVELVVAVALVVPAWAWGPWAALALTGGFTGAVAANLAVGRRPPCACFGAARARPISGLTLVRNAALVALAVVATG